MSKQAEQNYLAAIGEGGRAHSLNKPFSDMYCAINLASIGTIMALLPPPPARILDLGCGGGWTSAFMARAGYTVVGQDIAQDMIDLAYETRALHHLDDRLTFICGDYETLDMDGQFDAVLFFDCLHHADDERAALASAYRALRPGGILITHEPGEGHATSPGSIEAMRLYGVNERDMPPHLIIAQGLAIGFSSPRVLPMQHELMTIFYEDKVPPLFSKAAWLRAKRVLRAAFRPSHRDSAIVVLTR